MARFLPALRGKTAPAVQFNQPFGDALTPEAKAIITNYYGTLAAAAAAATVSRRTRAWDVQRAVAEGYERIVWVFKAVEVIAGNASRLPLKVMDGDQEVLDHPLSALLNGPKANPMETGQQFRKRLSAQVLLSRAGAFVEVTYSRRRHPVRVDLLPPARTVPIPGDADNPIAHFEVTDMHGRRRRVETENVRWFREPHPIDPYMGITPLEASGLSVELDFFARLYNAQFMNNDNRPGGILAVRGPGNTSGLSDPETKKLEARFGPGPTEAGKMSVISGDMTYLDMASKPRDVHYEALSRNMKVEILTSFGLDESIVGDTSGKTFANAGQAWENFWTLDPMPAHLTLLSTGWNNDVEPGQECQWVTDDVEPLRRAKEAALERARQEVQQGLRSIASYAELAGYGGEVPDTPQMHAFWVAQGRTPIPGRLEDAKALGFAEDGGAVVDAAGEAVGPAKDVAAKDVEEEPGAAPPPLPGQPGERSAADMVGQATGSRSAADVVAAAQGKSWGEPESMPDDPTDIELAALLDAAALESKALPRRPRPRRMRVVHRPDPTVATHTRDQEALDAAQAELAAALQALAERFAERTAARLGSPKTRKGTPHFAPEYKEDTRVGDRALDTARAVDEDTWAADTEQAAGPILTAVAVAAAAAVVAAVLPDVDPDPVMIREAAGRAVRGSLSAVTDSARRQAQRMVEVLSRGDAQGRAIAELQVIARDWAAHAGASWARNLALFGVVSVTSGAEAAAVQELIDRGLVSSRAVRRTWHTQLDQQVRGTHRAAEGQTAGVRTPFAVGGALLRYPGDPLAPIRETANCRCFLTWAVVGARMPSRVPVGA